MNNKQYIAILDDEVHYACHLMEYLNRSGSLPCEVCVFTSAEKLLSWSGKGSVILLMVAESEFDGTVAEAGFPDVLVLNESDSYLGEGIRSISKYQSMTHIGEYILREFFADREIGGSGIRHQQPMQIVGLYSPIHHCLQTTFALTMGQLLSERSGDALYLNFESYCGFEHVLQRTFRGSVGDLLFYNECARDKFAGQLKKMTESLGTLDFIPAMRSFTEMKAVGAEQWISLFTAIERVTDYRYLILDLTELTDGLFDILRCCSVVYTIGRPDGVSEAKMAQYELLLKAMDYQDVYARTRRLKLPVFHKLPARLDYLTHGELARYIRQLLKESPLQ